MESLLESYARVVGGTVIDHLYQLAESLEGKKVVHINSTKEGGGVAEILHRLVPLKSELGLDVSWEVITGDSDFYRCTKGMHNALQGNRIDIPKTLLRHYEDVNAENAQRLKDVLENADFVFIHDPSRLPCYGCAPTVRGNGFGDATST